MKQRFAAAAIAAVLGCNPVPVFAQAVVGDVTTAPKPDDALHDFLALNMLMAACSSEVSPFLLRTVDDYAREAGPKVEEMVNEFRGIGPAQLHLSASDCDQMLPQAVAKARLPGG